MQFFKEKNLKSKDLLYICARLRHEYFPPESDVVSFGNTFALTMLGEAGDKFYIILDGRVSVHVPLLEKRAVIEELLREEILRKTKRIIRRATMPSEMIAD